MHQFLTLRHEGSRHQVRRKADAYFLCRYSGYDSATCGANGDDCQRQILFTGILYVFILYLCKCHTIFKNINFILKNTAHYVLVTYEQRALRAGFDPLTMVTFPIMVSGSSPRFSMSAHAEEAGIDMDHVILHQDNAPPHTAAFTQSRDRHSGV